MNKIKFDILVKMNEGIEWGVKEYSSILYKPYSFIEQAFRELVHEGFIAENKLTEKAKDILKEHEIKNAVILSAGTSSRFVPLCFEKPKGLLSVKGEILIERQIRQLLEKGITEIIVVVGYMKEKFSYLQDKYGVILVETDTYKVRNNHASVYAAKEYLGSTIITSADLYFTENIFQKYAYDAYYCTVYREGETEERGVITDNNDRIISTAYGVRDTWVTLGYAYFNKRFSSNFLKIMDYEYNRPSTLGKFWADIQDEHLDELYMYAKRCDSDVIFEFDSLDELRQFDHEYIDNTGSVTMGMIARELGAKQGELTKFKPLAKEDLGRGILFTYNEKKYICHINKENNSVSVHRYDDSIQELINLTESFNSYYDTTLPLCAAENIISPFANLPLTMGFQERYIVGNTYSYSGSDNFIGSEYLLPFYNGISDICQRLFHAKYTDARTLTGMNCVMVLLMSLTKPGERIMLLGANAGGHASVKPIAERLGLVVYEAPFDYEKQDLDYVRLNEMLNKEKIAYVLLAPSDIIFPFDIQRMDVSNIKLLYDVSQMLGLIAGGVIANPLDFMENIVIFGGTHKTFPGPASGLIMTNDEEIHNKLETTINPVYIRHTQMHQKVSLLFALEEFEVFGKAYEEHIVELSNELGYQLEQRGFCVGKQGAKYSSTHEVFIYLDEEITKRIYENGTRVGVTMNKKHKQLFNGFGIRLGTQEIARYGWPKESMATVADIITELAKESFDEDYVHSMLSELPEKRIQYTFDDGVLARFDRFKAY